MPKTESILNRLRAGFQHPDPSARVLMRWWWFGPQVHRDDLVRDLDRMVQVGIGGVECAFVYPMSADSDRFLSDAFLADLRFAAQAAQDRDLRFDVTLGSGWPYGGPHIDATTASRRIHWETEEVLIGPQRMPLPKAWPYDEFIAAYIGEGTRADVPQEFCELQTEFVDGVRHILIPQGRGPRLMLIAVSRPTGQTVKRAAAGAEGWVLDHFSRAATEAHLAAVAEPLVEAAGGDRIGTVFCDSLEVYDADWTPGMAEEFAARRGYDVIPQLWKLTRADAAGSGVRADYYRTLTELLEENFITVVAQWARAKGLRLRIQGYGEPPATISSYRHAHAFEGEGWGWDTVTACRWASSAAQIYGEQVVSSETWTWVHSPSFRATPLDILGEAHDHLLMGVNHFVGHGWPASARPVEQDGGSPTELGRIFYASGALDDRNAWWAAAPSLWGTLHRLCWIMRQGHRLSQVGIYVPARDVYAGFVGAGRHDLFKEFKQYIGEELPRAVRTAGYDFDLFDDDAVCALDPRRFPVVVIPWAQDLPQRTREWLVEVIDAGGEVLDLGASAQIGSALNDPTAVTGHLPGNAGIQLTTFDPHTGEQRPNQGVAVTSREVREDPGDDVVRVHFVANTQDASTQVLLGVPGRSGGMHPVVLERWDAESGRLLGAVTGPEMTVTLDAYEAAVLVERADTHARGWDKDDRPAAARYEAPAGSASDAEVNALEGWTVQFPDESAPRPVALPHQWENEPGRGHYSGEAVYTVAFRVPSGARSVELDLGVVEPHQPEDPQAVGLMEASFSAAVRTPVGSVAGVEVDGQQIGFLWKTPYRIDLTDWVAQGRDHVLRLTVANVTSHRLAVDQGIPQMVAEAEAAFGRRFGIQAVELAMADVASGLLAVPQLRWMTRGEQENR
ncbi:glycosyl hydrolase [Nesterenkonia muleiensis]|uniref:glycosyl hydrolase n=1 Tax=Nesterenkonia muleiensis TaxID=2282648 RepID=UPI000E73723A|nr:glycosyl hydrolase [Nesterenkonia muleiensis]